MAEKILACAQPQGAIIPRTRTGYKTKPVNCEHCNQTVYRRVRGGKSDAGRFCSRDCAFAALAVKRIKREAELKVRKTVRLEIAAIRRIAGNCRRCEAMRVKLARLCIDCGASFNQRTHLGTPEKRCDACELAVDRSRKRIYKKKRKAQARGVAADSIDPIRVFDRDKWKCHICGVKTPKALRGTHEDRAPELEHIIPLSKGGGHTWGNVACACRKCNIEKGARSLGQLGLDIAA